MVVSPGTAGENDISLFFFDKDDVVDQSVRVDLELRYLDYETAPVEVSATLGHPGHAFIIGKHLRHAGRWQIEALLRRENHRGIV